MKRISLLLALITLIVFSCKEEIIEPAELIADFEITVSGESPNAEVSVTNNSENATSYSWTFGEGASIDVSAEQNPASFIVDKAGDFSVNLTVSGGTTEKSVSKTVSITGYNAIVHYTDLGFALNAGDDTYGRLFSFETDQMYLDSEINSDNGSKIHLAFGSIGGTLYYFDSPSESAYNVPNATITNVINYESTPTITGTDFNNMVDDRLLADLVIVDDNNSFGNSSIPGNTVLFEISTGRKGVILTKAVNSSRLLVDIKIQKY